MKSDILCSIEIQCGDTVSFHILRIEKHMKNFVIFLIMSFIITYLLSVLLINLQTNLMTGSLMDAFVYK